MPHVHLDPSGKVLAVYEQPFEGTVEVPDDFPALVEFVNRNLPNAGAVEEWVQSDLGLARVLEDLIEVLIDKKLIMFTDFPEGAQKKLLDRRGFRKEFDYVENLFGDEEDSFGDDPNTGGGFL